MSFWALAYQYGWANKSDLKTAVFYKVLTEDDYRTITGEPYQAD
jgi:Phage uncharacterised protein (Phage_XkdX)